MTTSDDKMWRPLSWYCSNCGMLVTAYKDGNGGFKVQCRKCGAAMIRTVKGRRHDTIELYAPKGQEHPDT